MGIFTVDRSGRAGRSDRSDECGTAGDATEQLARTRSVVDPALRAAVETMPESMRRIAGYHLGWWEADGTASSAPSPSPSWSRAVRTESLASAGSYHLVRSQRYRMGVCS